MPKAKTQLTTTEKDKASMNYDPPLTPEEFIQEVEQALPSSTPEEQYCLLNHARAWALVSYSGKVPVELVEQIHGLEVQYAIAG
jgi:hypothetical protein